MAKYQERNTDNYLNLDELFILPEDKDDVDRREKQLGELVKDETIKDDKKGKK